MLNTYQLKSLLDNHFIDYELTKNYSFIFYLKIKKQKYKFWFLFDYCLGSNYQLTVKNLTLDNYPEFYYCSDYYDTESILIRYLSLSDKEQLSLL